MDNNLQSESLYTIANKIIISFNKSADRYNKILEIIYNSLLQIINKQNMRFNQVLMFAFANTSVMREKKIKDLYSQMEQSMADLNQADASTKNATEKAYLKAFMNVMERMSKQLWDAKQKYRNLDKDKLKDQKCQKLAEQIKIFREECYMAKSRLEKVKLELKQQKLKEDLFNREKQALLISLKKVSQNKKENRDGYEKLKSFIQQQPRQSQKVNKIQLYINSNLNISLQAPAKQKYKKNSQDKSTRMTNRYKNSQDLNQKAFFKHRRPRSTVNYYRHQQTQFD